MKNSEPDFGLFEEPDDEQSISDDQFTNYKEEELRLTHVALRHQLLEKAQAFVSEGVQWRMKPLKKRLAELLVTYRMMTKLTEDE